METLVPSKNKTAVGRHRFRVLSAAKESAAQPERMRRFLNRGTLVVRVFPGHSDNRQAWPSSPYAA
jgi:hypothetical protein